MQDNSPASKTVPDTHLELTRLETARAWAADRLALAVTPDQLSPVSGDASFRRYFRIRTNTGSLILMDAPPPRENLAPFIDIAARLVTAGLRAPRIMHADPEQGFALLEDFGDRLYRELLRPDTVEVLVPGLFRALVQMARNADCSGLPLYDSTRLQNELDLFTHWYLLRHRLKTLQGQEAADWFALCGQLRESAAAQPQVFVHRDFHSCNLLYQEGMAPGIIDFQDAVKGPLCYDFVSLLWDRYIAWPRPQLEHWMETFRSMLLVDIDSADWVRYCDLMGLQRNFKVVGIFARLHYRDGRAGYLELIPRFYLYLLDVLARYPEFAAFRKVLEQTACEP